MLTLYILIVSQHAKIFSFEIASKMLKSWTSLDIFGNVWASSENLENVQKKLLEVGGIIS